MYFQYGRKFQKKLLILDYFILVEDTKFVACKSCSKVISSGWDSTKVYNTKILVNNLHQIN